MQTLGYISPRRLVCYLQMFVDLIILFCRLLLKKSSPGFPWLRSAREVQAFMQMHLA
jgi:hypothetical protein